MKRRLLSASILLMLLSSAAFAAPREDRGRGWSQNRGGDRGHGERERGERSRDWNRRGAWTDRHDGRWSDRRYAFDNDRHEGDDRRRWRRGDRMPVVYMQPRYYVQDWRAYRLAPPPHGYRWVRPPDGRFLLVAATTGLIADILGY